MNSTFSVSNSKFGPAKSTTAFVQGIANLNFSKFTLKKVYDSQVFVYTGNDVVDAEKADKSALSPDKQFYIGEVRNSHGKKVSGIYTVNPDTNVCWGAAAANMLAISGWADSVLNGNPAKVADYVLNTIRHGFKADVEADDSEIGIDGANTQSGISWFVKGVLSGMKLEFREGQYYSPKAPITVSVSDLDSQNGFQIAKKMDQALQNGSAVGADIFVYSGGQFSAGHAITVHGFVYDKTKKGKPGYYAGILISDSDDSIVKDPLAAPNQLKMQKLTWNARLKSYVLADYSTNSTYVLAGSITLNAKPNNVVGKAENNPLYYQSPTDNNWWLPGTPVKNSASASAADNSPAQPVPEIEAGKTYTAKAGEVWDETAIFGELKLVNNSTLKDAFILDGGVVKAAAGSQFQGDLQIAGQLQLLGAMKAQSSFSDLYDNVNRIDLLLTMRNSEEQSAFITHFNRLQGEFDLSITIDATEQADGRYLLATGSKQFNSTVSLFSAVDTEEYQEDQLQGYLSNHSTLFRNGKRYELVVDAQGNLAIQISVATDPVVGDRYDNLTIRQKVVTFAAGVEAHGTILSVDGSLEVAAGAKVTDTTLHQYSSMIVTGESHGKVQVDQDAHLYLHAGATVTGTIVVDGIVSVKGSVNAAGADFQFNFAGGLDGEEAYIEDIDLLSGATFSLTAASQAAYGAYLLGTRTDIEKEFQVTIDGKHQLNADGGPILIGNKIYALTQDTDELILTVSAKSSQLPTAPQVRLQRVADSQEVSVVFGVNSHRNEVSVNGGAYELYYDSFYANVTDYIGAKAINGNGTTERWKQSAALAATGVNFWHKANGEDAIEEVHAFSQILLDNSMVNGNVTFGELGGAYRNQMNALAEFTTQDEVRRYQYRKESSLNAAGSVRVVCNSAVGGDIRGFARISAIGGSIGGDIIATDSNSLEGARLLLDEKNLALKIDSELRHSELSGKVTRTDSAEMKEVSTQQVWTRSIREEVVAVGKVELRNTAFHGAIKGYANVSLVNDNPAAASVNSIVGGRLWTLYRQQVSGESAQWTLQEKTRAIGKVALSNTRVDGDIRGFAQLSLDMVQVAGAIDGSQQDLLRSATGTSQGSSWAQGSAVLIDTVATSVSGYAKVRLDGCTVDTLRAGKFTLTEGEWRLTRQTGSLLLDTENQVQNIQGFATLTVRGDDNRICGEILSVRSAKVASGVALGVSSEVLKDLWALGKNFTLGRNAVLYDLGSSQIAGSFTSDQQENRDNALDSTAQLGAGAKGWLSNQQDSEQALAYNDFSDFFKLQDAASLEGWQIQSETKELSVKIFRKVNDAWDGGTVVDWNNGGWDLSSVSLAQTEDYRIAVAVSEESGRGIFGYKLMQIA